MPRRFEFRLQTLLRVRELREREAKRKLGAKLAQLAQLDALDRQAGQEIARQHERLRTEQASAYLDAAAIARRRSWIAAVRRAMAERERLRAAYRGELHVLQDELRAARMQRRIIEKLRERRWNEHIQAEARGEQAAADELAQQLHVFRGSARVGESA